LVEDHEVALKKRKIEAQMDDNEDICIIDNDEIPHVNLSGLKKPSSLRKRKISEDIDCLIMCDDKHSD
jgi:hypothetical protein